MNLSFIGNRINQLRTNSGMTMAQLADIIDSSSGYISDLEKSKRIPSLDVLFKICQAFNITLSEFFNDDIKPLSLTPELKELLESAKNLSTSQLEALKTVAKSYNEGR